MILAGILASGCGGAGIVTRISPEEIRDQALAARTVLDPNVLPLRYRVRLRLDPAAAGYTGEMRIDLEVVSEEARSFKLHACGEVELDSVEVDGVPVLEVQRAECIRTITLAEPISAGRHTAHFLFRAPYGDRKAIYRFREGGLDYVASHMGEGYTRQAMPVFDEPVYRASWVVSVEAPKDLIVLANAPLIRRQPGVELPPFGDAETDGDWWRSSFAPTEPIPSYLFALAAGPYAYTAGKRDQRPRIRVFHTRDATGAGFALERTEHLLRALEDYTGTAYPYRKLDIIAVPEISTTAMENPGLIYAVEDMLLVNDGSTADHRRYIEWLLAHELAHMWFGNIVTMEHWRELWLNEAFATWLGARIVDRMRPEYRQRLVELGERENMFADDALGEGPPIRLDIGSTLADAQTSFSPQVYYKGAAVLRMIERWLGPEVMRASLVRYLATNRDRAANQDALVNAFPEDRRRELNAIFDSFFDQSGTPRVELSVACDGSPRVKATIGHHEHIARSLPAGTWTIPICVRVGGIEQESAVECAVIDHERDTIPLATCPAWIHPNAEEAGYFRWHFAEGGSLDALLEHVGELDERELAALPDQLLAAHRAGHLAADDLVRALAELAIPGLPPEAIARAAWILQELSPHPGMAHVAEALERQLPPTDGLDRDAIEAIARRKIEGVLARYDRLDLETQRWALSEARRFLQTGEPEPHWEATNHALRLSGQWIGDELLSGLLDQYGSVCDDWSARILLRSRDRDALGLALDEVLRCAKPIWIMGYVFRRNPVARSLALEILDERASMGPLVATEKKTLQQALESACAGPDEVTAWEAKIGEELLYDREARECRALRDFYRR